MFCMNCGAQLPSNAKFCLNCGAEIKIPDPNDSHPADKGQTEPVPDKERTDQQHKDDSVRAAVTKYKEQMKRAYLFMAVCEVITIFYALLIPDYTKYKFYAALTIMQKDLFSMMMKDFFSMLGIYFFGAVLYTICAVIITKERNTALGLPGIFTKMNLPPDIEEDLKHFNKVFNIIIGIPFMVAILIYGFRVITAIS